MSEDESFSFKVHCGRYKSCFMSINVGWSRPKVLFCVFNGLLVPEGSPIGIPSISTQISPDSEAVKTHFRWSRANCRVLLQSEGLRQIARKRRPTQRPLISRPEDARYFQQSQSHSQDSGFFLALISWQIWCRKGGGDGRAKRGSGWLKGEIDRGTSPATRLQLPLRASECLASYSWSSQLLKWCYVGGSELDGVP